MPLNKAVKFWCLYNGGDDDDDDDELHNLCYTTK